MLHKLDGLGIYDLRNHQLRTTQRDESGTTPALGMRYFRDIIIFADFHSTYLDESGRCSRSIPLDRIFSGLSSKTISGPSRKPTNINLGVINLSNERGISTWRIPKKWMIYDLDISYLWCSICASIFKYHSETALLRIGHNAGNFLAQHTAPYWMVWNPNHEPVTKHWVSP